MKLENQRANDTDGSALEAQPGKSQGRPPKARARSPPRKTACPHCVLPRSPCPSDPDPRPGPGQRPQTAFSSPEGRHERLPRGGIPASGQHAAGGRALLPKAVAPRRPARTIATATPRSCRSPARGKRSATNAIVASTTPARPPGDEALIPSRRVDPTRRTLRVVPVRARDVGVEVERPKRDR
jgi:hypothetical protein